MLVYLATNRISGRLYIGKTTLTVRLRWNRHIAEARRGSKMPFHYGLRKYGADAFEITELCVATSDAQLCCLEQAAIAAFRSAKLPMYNVTNGGDGTVGYKHTATSLAKMRRSRPHYTKSTYKRVGHRAWLGRTHTAESKAKMIAAKIGHKFYGNQWTK